MLRIFQSTVLAACLLLLCTNSLWAQKSADTIRLSETRILEVTRMALSPEETAGFALVLKKEALRAPLARTLPEAMMGSAGVYVQRTNLGGGAPFLRGLSGNQVLLLVDGIRMNNAIYRYGPVQYMNTVSLFDVSKLECYLGSGSVYYGSDALGGTINIVSQKPEYLTTAKLKPTAVIRTDLPTGERSASAGLELGRKYMAASARFSYRDFADVQPGQKKPLQSPSGYNEASGSLYLRFKTGRAEFLVGNQYMLQRQIPLYHRYALEGFKQYVWPEQVRQLHYLRYTWSQSPALHYKVNIAGSSQWETRQYRKKATDPLTSEKDRVNSAHLNLERLRMLPGGLQVTWLLDAYQDFVQSSRSTTDSMGLQKVARGLYPDRSKQGNASLGYLLHKKMAHWIIETGFRFALNRIDIPETGSGNMKDWQPAYSARFSLSRQLRSQYIYSAINTGYRVPNIDDFGALGLVDFRYEQPAYNLLPERNINLEMGTRFSTRRLNAQVAVFSNQLYGLISRVKRDGVFYQGVQVYEKMNTDRAGVFGVEATCTAQLTRSWQLSLQGSWQSGSIIKPRVEPMRRIPPVNGLFAISYRAEKLRSAFEVMGAGYQQRLAPGDISDNRIGPTGTPSWLIANVWAEYQMKGNHLLRLSIQNLGNAYYKTHGSGIWMPGRTLRIAYQF